MRRKYPDNDKYNRQRTPWAIHCFGDDGPGHGMIYLTDAEYDAQMQRAGSLWRCPLCGMYAVWDDDNHEDWYKKLEEQNGD